MIDSLDNWLILWRDRELDGHRRHRPNHHLFLLFWLQIAPTTPGDVMMHYDPYCLWGYLKLGENKFIMSLGYTYILNLENFQMQMGQRFPHLPSESSWRDTDQIVHARPYFKEVRHWQRRQHNLWASYSLFYYEHIPTSLVGSIFTRSYAHRYQHTDTQTHTSCYMHKHGWGPIHTQASPAFPRTRIDCSGDQAPTVVGVGMESILLLVRMRAWWSSPSVGAAAQISGIALGRSRTASNA